MTNSSLHRANLLEKAVKDFINGRLIHRSGAGKEKGDAVNKHFLVEAKYRSAEEKLNLQINWLVTISNQARESHKEPLLALEWKNGLRAFVLRRVLFNQITDSKELEKIGETLICNNESIGIKFSENPRTLIAPHADLLDSDKVWMIVSWPLFDKYLNYYKNEEECLTTPEESSFTNKPTNAAFGKSKKSSWPKKQSNWSNSSQFKSKSRMLGTSGLKRKVEKLSKDHENEN